QEKGHVQEGEREGGRESSEIPPPALCFARASGSAEAGPRAAWASTAFPGLRDFAKASGVQFGERFWRGGRGGPGSWAGARGGVPGTSAASLCVRPRAGCRLAPAARLARSRSARSAPAGDPVRLPGSQGARGPGLESLALLARGGRALLPWTSPVCSREEPGGTLQPTMKSWQLIAVVGDALQDIKADCNTCVEIEDRKGRRWQAMAHGPNPALLPVLDSSSWTTATLVHHFCTDFGSPSASVSTGEALHAQSSRGGPF
ncbi:PREDICTED: uncharacterized protein LOC109375391, partial [Hipposideros armiger]|uniref:Uncharacterized protein LOC109375391 n=1 Tax=Hipposideros armiger TaxID=186990 RepID=A0A8B7QF93_HIPAR